MSEIYNALSFYEIIIIATALILLLTWGEK